MIPRLIIAGTQSGAGKTTIASGLMRALAERGLRVQGFKAGPDYIDPQCHRWATGRPGRNLDTWMMSPDQVRASLHRGAADADIAVIEGVMGLYDGLGGNEEIGSTAYLAKLLQAPVILVIDAWASARSAAATALGFKMLDSQVPLAGVICNRVGGPGHVQMLRDALESVGIPMLGALVNDPALGVPEDRLGLALPGGDQSLPDWIHRAGEAVGQQLDLDQLMQLARSAPPLPVQIGAGAPGSGEDPFAPDQAGRFAGLRIGVGLDPAFWFYYAESFDLLRHWGVEPVFFSPLLDRTLPDDLHGLYLGGGFPERHAVGLAANGPMRTAVAAAVQAGLPVLAECGGYLYLLEGLTGEDGTLYPMAGCIPGVGRIQPRLQGMGYRVAQPGDVKGHLFHYTRVDDGDRPPAWQLHRPNGDFERADGYRQGSVIASYLHVHHATQPQVLDAFLSLCRGN